MSYDYRMTLGVTMSKFFTLSLGTYLGVPVLHHRLRVTDYDFILDKIRAKLSGCTARFLSLAGRVTLAVSVLAVVPTFFKQTTRLLASVCSKIYKIIRGFIWGSTNGVRRMSLVN
ncbi:hypothetical protein GQ457_16G013760 [Hibiscus cannabinus]